MQFLCWRTANKLKRQIKVCLQLKSFVLISTFLQFLCLYLSLTLPIIVRSSRARAFSSLTIVSSRFAASPPYQASHFCLRSTLLWFLESNGRFYQSSIIKSRLVLHALSLVTSSLILYCFNQHSLIKSLDFFRASSVALAISIFFLSS